MVAAYPPTTTAAATPTGGRAAPSSERASANRDVRDVRPQVWVRVRVRPHP